MKEVIELLLQKQASLEADREAEKALACEKIDAEYADRADKITALLDMAGYVPVVVDQTEEMPGETVAPAMPDAAADVEQRSAEVQTSGTIVY